MRAAIVISMAAALLLLGCQDLTATAEPPPLDEPYFRCKVQPVITKSCSMLACHGTPDRYFTVFARNRLRYGGTEDDRNATMRDIERQYNFESSRLQVDLSARDQSLLLLKPLDQSAGGYYHGGATLLGKGDVFLSRDEAGFETLSKWVAGATEDPTCIEPGSDQ